MLLPPRDCSWSFRHGEKKVERCANGSLGPRQWLARVAIALGSRLFSSVLVLCSLLVIASVCMHAHRIACARSRISTEHLSPARRWLSLLLWLASAMAMLLLYMGLAIACQSCGHDHIKLLLRLWVCQSLWIWLAIISKFVTMVATVAMSTVLQSCRSKWFHPYRCPPVSFDCTVRLKSARRLMFHTAHTSWGRPSDTDARG